MQIKLTNQAVSMIQVKRRSFPLVTQLSSFVRGLIASHVESALDSAYFVGYVNLCESSRVSHINLKSNEAVKVCSTLAPTIIIRHVMYTISE